jgi:hypothetical protein
MWDRLLARSENVKIVDVDIKELNNVSRRGRARSSETQQVIAAIEGLKPGEAKAIMLARGDSGPKMRSRLTYASRIAGKRLQVAIEEDRVLFALSGRAVRRRKARAAK